jgi:ABC-type phosphate/phosphonate transport system substrate-binding protein
MAMVLRLNEEQEKKLEELMIEVGEATKSKAIIYMIENSKEILRNDRVYKEIVRLEKEIIETGKKIATLKK